MLLLAITFPLLFCLGFVVYCISLSILLLSRTLGFPSPLLFSIANFEEVVRGMHCFLVALLGAPSTEGVRSSNLLAGEVQYCLQAFSRLFSCASSQLGTAIASLPPSDAAISQLRLLLEQLALEGQSSFNLPSPCNALAAEVLASGLHILYRTLACWYFYWISTVTFLTEIVL